MLNITDLTSSKELKRDDMAGIRGGFDPFAILDSSTRINSKVADITQGFDFALAQGNDGLVANNQQVVGGNGSTWAPVAQAQYQDNWLDISKVGNVSVS